MMSYKDAEKYSKGFIMKGIQVIVESRLGEKVIKKCSPPRNDWFHIAINDIKEVEEHSLKCLDHLRVNEGESIGIGFTISGKWKICCEISLQTNDNQSMTLEYWLFENNPIFKDNELTNGSLTYHFPTIYNRMSILLKSLMTLTRATPTHKLSSKGQSEHSHVICYRIYQCDFRFNHILQQSGVNAQEIQQHFTSEIKLGSIRSSYNVINVSFCYRTDMARCKSSENTDTGLPFKNDHFVEKNVRNSQDKCGDGRLLAAFGSSPSECISFPLLPEFHLDSLLSENEVNSTAENNEKSENSHSISEPILIPETKKPAYTPASGDSFVMIDAKAPFAPDNDCDVNSFFNGPSPSFKCEKSVFDELNDISNQLAAIESSAEQWDSFIDSVCSPDSEEEEVRP